MRIWLWISCLVLTGLLLASPNVKPLKVYMNEPAKVNSLSKKFGYKLPKDHAYKHAEVINGEKSFQFLRKRKLRLIGEDGSKVEISRSPLSLKPKVSEFKFEDKVTTQVNLKGKSMPQTWKKTGDQGTETVLSVNGRYLGTRHKIVNSQGDEHFIRENGKGQYIHEFTQNRDAGTYSSIKKQLSLEQFLELKKTALQPEKLDTEFVAHQDTGRFMDAANGIYTRQIQKSEDSKRLANLLRKTQFTLKDVKKGSVIRDKNNKELRFETNDGVRVRQKLGLLSKPIEISSKIDEGRTIQVTDARGNVQKLIKMDPHDPRVRFHVSPDGKTLLKKEYLISDDKGNSFSIDKKGSNFVVSKAWTNEDGMQVKKIINRDIRPDELIRLMNTKVGLGSTERPATANKRNSGSLGRGSANPATANKQNPESLIPFENLKEGVVKRFGEPTIAFRRISIIDIDGSKKVFSLEMDRNGEPIQYVILDNKGKPSYFFKTMDGNALFFDFKDNLMRVPNPRLPLDSDSGYNSG